MTANVTTPTTTANVNVTAAPVVAKPNLSQPASAPPSEPPLPTSPSPLWPMVVATLAMVVAAICLIVSYWMVQKTNKVENALKAIDENLAGQQARVDNSLVEASQQMKQALNQQQEVISKLPAQAETWLAPQIQPLKQALDLEKQANGAQESRLTLIETRQDAAQSLLAELPTQKLLWQMMEVVQLTRGALVRLKVEHDVASAQASLSLAIDILRRLRLNDKGALLAHAEKVLQALAEQESSDPYVLNQQLIALNQQINQLMYDPEAHQPFIKTLNSKSPRAALPSSERAQAPQSAELPWYQLLWRDAFAELGALVRFTPEDRPLMPPDGKFFIEQNMALSLLTMRSAALRHDYLTFAAERQQLTTWIEQFAENGEAKTKTLAALAQLQSFSFNVDGNGLKQLVGDAEVALTRLQQASGGRP